MKIAIYQIDAARDMEGVLFMGLDTHKKVMSSANIDASTPRCLKATSRRKIWRMCIASSIWRDRTVMSGGPSPYRTWWQ